MRDVPGPPRGRATTRPRGAPGERVEAARARERMGAKTAVRGVLRLAGDIVVLLGDLARDPRVPLRHKAVAVAALSYVASPVDLVPSAVPVIGRIDDVIVVALAVRALLAGAGHDVVYELWRGSDEGLALVLNFAGVDQ